MVLRLLIRCEMTFPPESDVGIESEYFLHVTGGGAGPASPLMARIALSLGHHPKAYPMDLSDIKAVTELSLKSDGSVNRLDARARRALNEFMVLELARQAVMSETDWREDQIAALRALAGAEAVAKVRVLRAVEAPTTRD